MCDQRPPERDETMNGFGSQRQRLESRPTPAAVLGLCRRNGSLARRRAALAAWGLAALLIFGPLAIGARLAAAAAPTEPAKSVALLNVQFLNDHEDLEPTTGAERARLALIASLFKAKLEASGRYTFVSIPADTAAKIAAGPEVGACGGCEFGYGKELGADTVAWIVVQKVSDLILNINVYMADVAARKIGVRPQRRHSRQHGRIRGPGG